MYNDFVKNWKKENSGLFVTDFFLSFRLAKLMKSLALWEITLSVLICLIPSRPNLSRKTKYFTLTLPNSYLSKCFFLVETKNVSVQIINNFSFSKVILIMWLQIWPDTQYMTNPTIVYPVKMENGWNFSISGLKMMVKSGLEKIFLKFLHAQAIFY